ncbi:cation transporter [Maricaulis sp.]|uniref:cation transporter n=1 Tax=unclassified Maricaulis TaxID=2632371 RepID=UPI001B0F497E|nr:cation transporter [Maricaulis sp.]MBO6796892.1 cation transporter [Maricaulis sp.]
MDCCSNQPKFDGTSKAYRRALIAVIVINAVMFFVEAGAGVGSGSEALKADALDFAGDALTYTISLAVIGSSLALRAKAAMFKGVFLGATAAAVLAMAVIDVFAGELPSAPTMGWIGTLALVANLVSVLILLRWRDGDANVRSVWLCSRNDAIGNVGVVIAGFLVFALQSRFPDLILAVLMAGLFLRSAVSIIKQARAEMAEEAVSNRCGAT